MALPASFNLPPQSSQRAFNNQIESHILHFCQDHLSGMAAFAETLSSASLDACSATTGNALIEISAQVDSLQRALAKVTLSSGDEDSSRPLPAPPQHPYPALNTSSSLAPNSTISPPLQNISNTPASTRRRPREAPREVLEPDRQTKQKRKISYGIK